MKDRFDEVMDEILIPIEKLDYILDTSYFLKDTGSFFYTEGYYHPGGRVIGKIIYYPDKEGESLIHGRPYTSIVKKEVDGEEIYIPHDEQIRIHYRIDKSLKPEEQKLLVADYLVAIPLESFVGYFDPKRSLRYAMERHEDVDEAVKKASEILDVPLERMGVTGSSAVGRRTKGSDIDLVMFGTPEENFEAVKKIWCMSYVDREKRVVKYGKFWPLKFYLGDQEMCCFFAYSRKEDVPLADCRIELVKDGVEAYGSIKENINSYYMPVILELNDVWVDAERADDIRLIIYDGAVRGEFFLGERLHISGKLIRVTKGDESYTALLASDGDNVQKEHFHRGAPKFQQEIRKMCDAPAIEEKA